VAIANRRVQRGRRIPVSHANGLTQRDSNGNCDADSNCYGNCHSYSYSNCYSNSHSYGYRDGNGNCHCGAEVYANAKASSDTAAATVVSLETVL
jgi:hypothetical protein